MIEIAVQPGVRRWADIEALGQDFRLMFDAVINHISRHSVWFQGFLRGDPEYIDWFLAFDLDASTDWIPQVVRPRPWPLLTCVQTGAGDKLVWTTFSEDQIDLNFAHPPVLLKILEILLLYVEKGAQIIRLDAIAYLWKALGTPCIHLEETHRVVKLMRCVLDAVAPATILITETSDQALSVQLDPFKRGSLPWLGLTCLRGKTALSLGLPSRARSLPVRYAGSRAEPGKGSRVGNVCRVSPCRSVPGPARLIVWEGFALTRAGPRQCFCDLV